MSSSAQAASGPQAPGQISPLPMALAPIAAGNAPGTDLIEPSSASSPIAAKPSMASGEMAPMATIMASAIGRSKWLPSLGSFAQILDDSPMLYEAMQVD